MKALISVYDKSGIEDLGGRCIGLGLNSLVPEVHMRPYPVWESRLHRYQM